MKNEKKFQLVKNIIFFFEIKKKKSIKEFN